MVQKIYLTLLFLALFVGSTFAQTVIPIKDGDLAGNTTYNWTKDNVYELDGFVFLEEGGVLNIEAGTVIKGKLTPTTGDLASTLIIARGAQIFAEGTANEPIIFTSTADDLDNPNDLPLVGTGSNKLWGGLIILGNAVLGDETSEVGVEGIPVGETRALYGGTDDADNSGVLRYISIRHGGAALSSGNEINGLTLGGVGSGTTIEFVEVFANFDDGIEFFGGTVSVKYAAVSYAGDDGFDYDTGWRGNGQFWFALNAATFGDHGGEHDGAKPDANPRFSQPVIYNATYIGGGTSGTAKNEHAILFRDGTGGFYGNSIITEFANGAIQVEDLAAASGVDSRQRMENGELVLANNIWFGFGAGDELKAGELITATSDAEDPTAQFLVDHLTNNNNSLDNPELTSISRTNSGTLDPRPSLTGPAYQNLASYPDTIPFFQEVNYKGAFGGTNWLRGWTALDAYGFIPEQQEVVVKDEDINAGDMVTWTSDNVYLLDGFVYVEPGAKLTIEPGTVIKGKQTPSTGDLASTLIITRGAMIMAEGTESQPIIFTAQADDLSRTDDLPVEINSLWGGLIILGNGVLGDETSEVAIEGLPADEERALYGGTNDADNSGILKYVSLRHGGAALSPGNEINGLTLGAVGSGTTIEYVEVFANFDDGIEWFGGAAEVKYATVAFCGDDSYDYDTGWRGKGQFWLSLQSSRAGDNGGEHDGAKPDANPRFSQPEIFNATYIGSGTTAANKNEHALLFRDGTGATYGNSVFTQFANYGIQVEDLPAANGLDSRQRMENGELQLLNNIWWDFGNGNGLQAGQLIQATGNAEDPTAQFLVDHLTNNNNTVEDPGLQGISRTTDGGFDPRPMNNTGTAYSGLTTVPADDFFDNVEFKGAFCDDGVWIKNWTALSAYGILNSTTPAAPEACDLVTSTSEPWVSENGYVLAQNTPNPAFGETTILVTLPETAKIDVDLYDVSGKLVKNVVSGQTYTQGEHTINMSVADINNGTYFYTLRSEGVILTNIMVVQH